MSESRPQSPADLLSLRHFSARIGSDRLIIQAAGGNTSIKDGDTLWIKASGTWLMHAMERNIFVPVNMPPLNAAVASGDPTAENAHQFTVAADNPAGLRPSIETTVHALMPQRVVAHVHCVDTIALAIRRDGEAVLGELLKGINWAHVSYARPGLPLALGISRHMAKRPDVLVLGNHGLVVAAETVDETERLLRDIRKRLTQPVRVVSDMNRLQTLGSTNYVLPQNGFVHTIATDPLSLAMAGGGSLYPDHVVFLGKGVVVAADGESVADTVKRLGYEPPMILLPGIGVVMRANTTSAAHAMASCLADVLVRVPEGSVLRYLTNADNDELMNWDAEKYRQQLEAKSRG